jgi:hypothetical protein
MYVRVDAFRETPEEKERERKKEKPRKKKEEKGRKKKDRDPNHSDTSAKSRTSYIITLGGCPILWKSQLQTEMHLSVHIGI